MIKPIKITEFKDNKALTSNKKIIDYLNPKYIYIPLFDNNDHYDLCVNINQNIKIGEIIAISSKYKIPYHSSISGIVKSVNKKMWTNSGKLIECVEIENDYKNESIINLKNNTLEKDHIINVIKECGIVGMGGAGFPTYIKYLNNDLHTLIVNGCECEPFITCDYRLMIEKTIKLINGIHYVLKAINGKRAFIAIKENKKELIKILEKYTDEQIKIFLVPDKYPVGYERYLVNKIMKTNYQKLPSEVGCVVNNVSTIIAIYDAIKYNTPLINRVVTITGYCLEKPINVNCKIGTNIQEIINNIIYLKHKYHKKHCIVGGVMTGKSVVDDNIIVTKTLNAVIINPYLRKSGNVLQCIGCGKCSNICPTKLTPTQIMKKYLIKNTKELQPLKPELCIQCGLCSYICPSRIDLSNFVLKAKQHLRRENTNDKKI